MNGFESRPDRRQKTSAIAEVFFAPIRTVMVRGLLHVSFAYDFFRTLKLYCFIMKKTLSFLVVLLVFFVVYTFISTGFFRAIEQSSPHAVVARVPIKGAEDIVVDEENHFAIISATNRQTYPPVQPETGNLYYLDLEDPSYTPVSLSDNLDFTFAPHGIDMMKINDSTYHILAINHVDKQHSIEHFFLNKDQLTHVNTYKDSSMVQPNDLVFISPEEFYFTNDHGYTEGLGKLVEEYGGLAVSNVVHVKQQHYTEAADGIAYANGIAYDKERALLFVASPRHFEVKVYQYEPNGALRYIEAIPAHTGVDNITLDENGILWIGAHPNLLRFAAYAKGDYAISPSEIVRIDYRKEGEYTVESYWVDNGEKMSGATVAVPYMDKLLVGNVMDDHFLILAKNSTN